MGSTEGAYEGARQWELPRLEDYTKHSENVRTNTGLLSKELPSFTALFHE